ncbi:hypothetical protein ACFE04_025253 [Oxalis oulophora]
MSRNLKILNLVEFCHVAYTGLSSLLRAKEEAGLLEGIALSRTDGKVMINPVSVEVLEAVADLIGGPRIKWKDEIIFQLFPPGQAVAILSIPLRFGDHKDQCIWKGTREGRYSVKSGYNVAWDRLFGSNVW